MFAVVVYWLHTNCFFIFNVVFILHTPWISPSLPLLWPHSFFRHFPLIDSVYHSSAAAFNRVTSEDTVPADSYILYNVFSSHPPFQSASALCFSIAMFVTQLIMHPAFFYASSCLHSIAPPFLLLPYPMRTLAPLFQGPSPDSKLFSSRGLPIQAP